MSYHIKQIQPSAILFFIKNITFAKKRVNGILYITIPIVLFNLLLLIGYPRVESQPDTYKSEISSHNSWERQLVDSIGISDSAFKIAINGFKNLKNQNKLQNDSLIVIIDFSKPSVEKRFYLLDIKNQKIIKKTLVAHGKNSGLLTADTFSNTVHSNQSSLGWYVTQNPYQGKHGYSLRIDGMSEGLNDNAYRRAVVIHGANYVSEDYISRNGRIGRSFGCPALPVEETKEIIDLIKEGTCLLIYHPSLEALAHPEQERLM
jgi:hypothetical protein